MGRKRKTVTKVTADTKDTQEGPRIPEKPRLRVLEVARIVAKDLGLNEHAAKVRIYRRIESGEIRAVRVLGSLMIPREEVVRIIQGDQP